MKKITSVLLAFVLLLPVLSFNLLTASAVMEEMSSQDVQSVEILWPLLEKHNSTYYANYPKLQSHTVNQACSSSHNGIDIWTGTNNLIVSAVADGVVDNIWTTTGGNYPGNQYIRIKHENLYKGTVYSLYCHLSGYYAGIKKGSVVKAGDPVAYSGNSGNVAYHLHFSMFRTTAYYGTNEQVINNNKDTGVFKYSYSITPSHTHSYSRSYEAAHPHRVYMQCSCGDYYYTGETQYILTCSQCNSASVSEGYYFIETALQSGKYLDVTDASKQNGANIQLWEYTKSLAQIFKIEKSGNFYTISSVCSNLMLDVANGSAASGANVQQYSSNGSTAQQWNFQIAENGYYYIQSCLGTYLTAENSGTANGTNIQTSTFSQSNNAQLFKLLIAPQPPVATVSAGTSTTPTIVTWNSALGADSYDLYIHNISKDENAFVCYNISSTGGSYSLVLDAGQYYATLCSKNSAISNYWIWGNKAMFTVADANSYTISFDLVYKDLCRTQENADCINQERVRNFVIYTAAFGSTTRANEYGEEITVNENGKVTSKIYGVPGGQIPTKGFVLSSWNSNPKYEWFDSIQPTDYIWCDYNSLIVKVYSTKEDYDASHKNVQKNAKYGTLPTPERTGYIFDGWYTAANDGTKITSDSIVNLTQDQTLYAHWTKKQITLPGISIHNYVANRTVGYKTTITFSADVTNPVSGASVHWFIDGQDKGTGEKYTVTKATESFTVQTKYIKDGKALAESGVEKVSVKTGFFAKLLAFFRSIFGALPKVVQGYMGAEIIEKII